MDDRAAKWNAGIDHVAASDVGMRRMNNQDSYAEFLAGNEETWRQRGHLFIVADGMGAHAAGELASKISCDNIPHLYGKFAGEGPPVAIRKAIEMANNLIHERAEANAEFHGMGTTSSCLVLTPQGSFLGHVGDSRVYRLRGEQLDQLTFDHSLVWEVRRANHFQGADVGAHLPKNIITRSLGPNAKVEVDVEGPLEIRLGDVYLLCSDGLTGQVKNEELGAILACLPPAEAARALIDLANLRGGPDNITVEVIRVEGAHVASNVLAAEDAADSPEQRRRGLAISLLAATGLSGAALLALGVLLQQPLALVGAGAALIALGPLVWWYRNLPQPRTPVTSSSTVYGRAPYDSCQSWINANFVSQLRLVFEQLRDAAKNEDWEIDWHKMQDLVRPAEQAGAGREWRVAIRHYLLTISFLMKEIYSQPRRKRSAKEDEGSIFTD